MPTRFELFRASLADVEESFEESSFEVAVEVLELNTNGLRIATAFKAIEPRDIGTKAADRLGDPCGETFAIPDFSGESAQLSDRFNEGDALGDFLGRIPTDEPVDPFESESDEPEPDDSKLTTGDNL